MTGIRRAIAYRVSFVLVGGAVLAGRALRVPGWLRLPCGIGGWAYAFWLGGAPLLGWSLAGAVVGLACLMPLYAIGGMGAGDVKLMAGVGAWIGPACTFWAFLATALVGGAIGLAMMAASGELA